MFDKELFSERGNRLTKSVTGIAWIYGIHVRRNKTRWDNNTDCNKPSVPRTETRIDGNSTTKLKSEGHSRRQIRFFEKA